MLLEEQYETIRTAKELVNSSDENLKSHALFCVENGREDFKFAMFYAEGLYEGASLWVLDNTTFTVRSECLKAQHFGDGAMPISNR